ncbi:MAG: hypothetical protein JWL61_2630, partial [Gemmatimonadetes bacterium]|nr:hypothetical protein [Gemmatimonadota bacterium]
MKDMATTSGDVAVLFHTNEYPRVAHIVADLDNIESDMDLCLPL